MVVVGGGWWMMTVVGGRWDKITKFIKKRIRDTENIYFTLLERVR